MLIIEAIKAFSDNYLWLLHSTDEQQRSQASVVDPGDAGPVIAALEARQLNLTSILLTHWHPDHIGGVDELLQRYPCTVYGPRSKHIPQVTQALKEQDEISVLGQRFVVYEVPGHTLDHIAYYAPDPAEPLLFCGDTLFAGGCGRMFEGQPDMMLHSLQKLAALDPATRVYCAHEYTQANLRFALAADPDNPDLKKRVSEVNGLRAKAQATVPSNLALELRTNPFLRTTEPALIKAASQQLQHQTANATEVFAALRQWKDNF